MSDGILTESGKLRDQFLPAVYFDSSVLIDYWLTEGSEIELPEGSVERIMLERESEDTKILRELLKSDRRIAGMIEIRKKLLFENVKVSAVISPLSLLELMEWNAEAAFKETAVEVAGTLLIQRKSKKEIGDYLKKPLELREEEVKTQRGQKGEIHDYSSTGLEIIMGDTWLNRSFAECHGLQGLLQADIINFRLAIDQSWQEPFVYAYLQLGISDIFHILIAQHLGCEYFASFDSDFVRVKDIIKKESGITLLSSPEEILGIL
jgi:hypothetical protein